MYNDRNNKSLWLITREYAGLAEAGGVKNVVKSLAEEAAAKDFSVTVFLPHYGNMPVYSENPIGKTVYIRVVHTLHSVQYYELYRKNIRFILIDTSLFSEKQDIYTYCAKEITFFREKLKKPALKKGDGYVDSDEMNILFQKAVYCYALQYSCAPEVLHCHDAHTALLPAIIFSHTAGQKLFRHTRMLITIHNAGDGYRQSMRSLEYAKAITGLPSSLLTYGLVDNAVEPFLVGAPFAVLTTVSPWYAEQLKNPAESPYSYQFSKILTNKKITVTGITNGIDFNNYDPVKPEISGLPYSFDICREQFEGKYACRTFFIENLKDNRMNMPVYEGVQWFGFLEEPPHAKHLYAVYHGRFVHQKGIDVLLSAIPLLMAQTDILRVIIMGQGNTDLEAKAITLTDTFAGKCIYCKGYNRKVARLITAMADFMILPSLFEPCGLEDFIAQIYGTIPLAHAQGGLQKIRHGQTGFLYTVPKGGKDNIKIHAKILSKLLLRYTSYFTTSSKKYLLDIPYFRNIIMQADKVLHNEFSWGRIFNEQYYPLYCKDDRLLPDTHQINGNP